jgi:hypothetical protein
MLRAVGQEVRLIALNVKFASVLAETARIMRGLRMIRDVKILGSAGKHCLCRRLQRIDAVGRWVCACRMALNIRDGDKPGQFAGKRAGDLVPSFAKS